jgi:predicted component of type VI protein secretion system
MAILRLFVTHAGRRSEMTFRDPTGVRIGRDLSNECRLALRFVSRRHARIDVREGRLLLSDEGSRAGTWIGATGRRLAPGHAVDLASVGYEFSVGAIRIHAELVDGLEPRIETQLAPSESVERAMPQWVAEPIVRTLDAPSSAGCGTGWVTALATLDPEVIECAVAEPGGPSRHEALWSEFVRRYDGLRRGCP